MKESYKVYRHIFPNGKCYIGITSLEPNIRWGYKGRKYSKQPFLWNAIVKYGWENIKHEILYKNLTKEEAETKEIELITKYKSNQRKFGYNIDNGGKCEGTHSEETKRKIGNAHRNKFVNDNIRKKYLFQQLVRKTIILKRLFNIV